MNSARRLDCPAAVHPELAAHGALFEKKIYRVGDRVHCAVGYGLANVIAIEGPTGLVVVDTGGDVAQAGAVMADLRQVSDAPLAAIVYTHHHTDHVQGTTALLAGAPVPVPIYAHSSLLGEYEQETGVIGPIMGARAMAMYSMVLAPDDLAGANAGIGPFFVPGENGFVPPTHTFDQRLEVELGGVRMLLQHVPSEANSEICVVLPDDGVLLSAEVIQDHGFPNLYTLRGANFRDPKRWYESIDLMAALASDCEQMVLQHGPPVLDRSEMREVLRNYRDAIQYTFDQTIRWANRGLAKDEIASRVELPPHLRSYAPWLRPFYGSVEHAVPQIYSGYLGWFDGDPVALDPTPRDDLARRLVALMGGRQRVLEEASAVLDGGDAQYAAELATYLVRSDRDDGDARQIKAGAYRALGAATPNATWRGFYLTGAAVLDGSLDLDPIYRWGVEATVTPELLATLPARFLIEALGPRLSAEEVLDVDVAVLWHFTDVGESYLLHVRRGVAAISDVRRSPEVLGEVAGSRAALGPVLVGVASADALVSDPGVSLSGSAEEVLALLGHFELLGTTWPNYFVR